MKTESYFKQLIITKKNELENELKTFKKIETTSRRVTINSKSENLIFYITNINGNWYFIHYRLCFYGLQRIVNQFYLYVFIEKI